MSFLAYFFIVFCILAFVVGPWLRIEDRPGFKRPERKPRQPVGSWFARPR